MDVIKDSQGQSNKIYSKIVHVENGKITKKFDINYRSKIPNKRKNELYTKSNENKKKPLTTEVIFKNKNLSNYQPLSNKNSNSNPFRNSVKSQLEKENKKNTSIKKFFKDNININSSDAKKEKNCFKEKEIADNIKKNKNKNKDINMIIKRNIYENQIKNTVIQVKEKDKDVQENKNSNQGNKIIQKILKKNGKEELNTNINDKNTEVKKDNNFKKKEN